MRQLSSAVFLLLGLIAATQTANAADLPNVLWISCEDVCPDLGCYGDKYARTPNIDKLAREGIRYTHAFSVSGVCAPSRSAIITGMYPTTISTHHMRCKAVPPACVKCFTEYLRSAGYYCTNNSKTDYNFDAPVTAWDECSNKAHWRNRTPGQPFFSVFNLTVTHESQIRCSPEQFARHMQKVAPEHRHDPAKAVLPPYYPDTPIVRNDWARYYDLITAMDLQLADLLRQLEEDGLADKTIVFFFGDNGRGLPRAKRWLYDSGIHVPLVIRLPDRKDAGTVCDDLISFIDFGPTVLSLAGVKVPAHMQGQPFLGGQRAGPRQYVFAARDRMDETYDIIRSVRDKRFKYIRNFKPGRPYAQYIDYMEKMPTMQEMRRLNKEGTLTGPRKTFFLPEKPEEELYDCINDPHEITNLVNLPEHRERLIEMRKVLEKWMDDTRDLGLIPEEELNERMRPGGRWAVTAAPVMEPPGGSHRGPASITIFCPTEAASIAWTCEEGEQAHWRLYCEPIRLSHTATVRAKAVRLGYKESPEVRAEYRIEQ
ncbi:MAG TPA: sulfatase-like hydrolase/transferase [Phycisphaerae bacterium]|nr:sulfatase-like hydrolase/transferase [Phycisphaerae bacterium]HRR83816.1 sulfatase-like hydrolase/transferase [Phycisphaerae bacterium]